MSRQRAHRVRIATISVAVASILAGAPGTFHAQPAVKPGEGVTLNFANADIEAVARTLAVITGRNVVVDPRVKGTMNLQSERPQPPAAAWNQFLAALRLQGFAVVESAGLYKVVPEADAKLQGSAVNEGPLRASGSQLLTQIFRLNHENAGNLVPVLRPLISPNNTINVNAGNNSLVITDYADNLQRIARIIAALDLPNATDVDVMPLKHALAQDIAPLVTRLLETSAVAGSPSPGGGQGEAAYRTTVLADTRSNALIVRAANPARLALARSLVERLDQPSSASASGNIHVVYLKNADATRLAAVLRAAMSGESRGSTPVAAPVATAPAAAGAAANGSQGAMTASAQPSTGGQIQADVATNSLIITAPEPQYRQLRAVIDQLDQRRAQVFVESLIAEVNADKAAEFGVQWMTGGSGRGVGVLAGTNYGIGGANLLNLATQGSTGNVTLPSTGLNLGVGVTHNGKLALGALARFLQENGDGNILSTPTLLTLDNEEAKIVIGQNVPFVTGQYTNNNSASGSVNPFQTIERKDVGLTLRIRPQISENGTVKLQIFQEVSSVQASTINSASGPTTNKRSIESTVLVDDGSIVVLGGLLQDEYSGNQEKVPGLGDVPLFGNLFKSETRSRKKTNLMVFLRPLVVRDAAASDQLSLDRYELMRALQQRTQPRESSVVPVNEAPVLPAPPPARPASAPAKKP
jgi:general secretion pathway protein D